MMHTDRGAFDGITESVRNLSSASSDLAALEFILLIFLLLLLSSSSVVLSCWLGVNCEWRLLLRTALSVSSTIIAIASSKLNG